MANHRQQHSGSYSSMPVHSPTDPSFYPQRPNSYFGAQPRSGSQASYRDSHEMMPSPGGSTGYAGKRTSRHSGRDNPHAFGDDGSDSEDSDDGQGFNVYKDFNNAGAKYSAALSSGDIYRDDPYGSAPDSPHPGRHSRMPTSHDAIVETTNKSGDLVSAPHLGTDWQDAEARKDKRWEGKGSLETREAWRRRKAAAGASLGAWRRGERKIGGWFGWRHGIFVVFFLLIAFGVTLYFVIPRVPLLAYNHETFMVGDNTTMHFSRTPTNFTFDATMNLALDGRNSYIPVHATDISVTVIDLSSSSGTVKVGEGKGGSLTTSTKGYQPFSVPIHFQYSAPNTSDSTWLAYYDACAHIWPGNATRPTLLWNVIVQYKVAGLVGTKGDSTTINSVECPIELPATGA